MLFLLIFPVLVAGFVACHIHPVHSYRLHRYEGQYLYLKSAELGLKSFFLACLMSAVLHHWLADSFSLCGWTFSLRLNPWLVLQMTVIGAGTDGEATKMAWFLQLSFLSFVSAYILKFWAHFSLRRRFGVWNAKVFVIGELLEDSPLDNLLFRLSLDKQKSAMLTMEDRKVYVGKIVNLGEPSATSGMDQDILIMPMISGYRDKDTLKVEFTTFYSEVEAEILISLRQDNIVSATEFLRSAYQIWNPKAGKAPATDPTGERRADAAAAGEQSGGRARKAEGGEATDGRDKDAAAKARKALPADTAVKKCKAPVREAAAPAKQPAAPRRARAPKPGG